MDIRVTRMINYVWSIKTCLKSYFIYRIREDQVTVSKKEKQ